MKKLLLTTCLGASLLAPTLASAADDGFLGDTSSGSFGVSVRIEGRPEPKIQITGLQDLSFGNVLNGDTPSPVSLDNICVFHSDSTSYSIELESQDGIFGILSGPAGSADGFRYDSVYTDSSGTTLTESSGSGLTGSSVSDCSDGNFASLQLIPSEPATFLPVSGLNINNTFIVTTITVTVSPE